MGVKARGGQGVGLSRASSQAISSSGVRCPLNVEMGVAIGAEVGELAAESAGAHARAYVIGMARLPRYRSASSGALSTSMWVARRRGLCRRATTRGSLSASFLYCWQGAHRSAVAKATRTLDSRAACSIARSSGGADARIGGSGVVALATMKPVCGS